MDSPWLGDDEKESLSSILKVARQRSDRSLRILPGKKVDVISPEYYDETLQQTVYHGFRSRRQKTMTVRWICVPYFVIGEPATTENMVNDQPPVSFFLKSGYAFEGKYFQCAQLWCLVLGDGICTFSAHLLTKLLTSLGSLFTCARRSIPDLPGNLVNIKALPPADPERRLTGDRAPVLIVSDGGIRTWLLPVVRCLTWSVC